MMSFSYPWQYSFPPFFTLQPNLETRRRQLTAWKELILSYYKHNKQSTLSVSDAASSLPFHNPELQRTLSDECLEAILEELYRTGNLEWRDKQKSRCYIYWKAPSEIGKNVYQWIQDRGMTGSICTVFELTQGDDTSGEEFYGLDENIFLKAMRSLEKDGKAEVVETGDGYGVKFF